MTALYRALLICYPRAFRDRFGDELTTAFEEGLRAARQRGIRAAWVFAFTRLIDVIASGLGERRADRTPLIELRFWATDTAAALKSIRRQPGFSALVIAILAIGIGASSAVFSVIDAVLLHPLPYANANRLVVVLTDNAPLKISGGPTSYPDFADWRASGIFEDIGIYQRGSAVVRFGDTSERLRQWSASTSLFTTLGVAPILGRFPTADEDRPSAQPVVLLAYGMWNARYKNDPGVIGRTISIDGAPLTIVGVLPQTFHFDGDPDLWTTFLADEDLAARQNRYLDVVARLSAQTPIADAAARMRALCANLDAANGGTNKDWRASVRYWSDAVTADTRPQLIVLAAGVALVLLIGAANIAMLLLVRGARRQKEMAVRTALGASRGRMVSLLLAEHAVLAIAGGAAGLAAARGLVALAAAFGPSSIPRLADASINGRAVLFALGASVVSALLCGIIPALRSTAPRQALQEATRSATPAPRRRMTGQLLLGAEAAISAALLIGAVLLLRSFVAMTRVDVGFAPDNLLTFQLPLPPSEYLVNDTYQPDRVRQHYADVVAALETRPDVASAAATLDLPIGGGGIRMWQGVEVIGHPATSLQKTVAVFNQVTPQFFSTMGMTIQRGRAISSDDHANSAPVAVVSESFVRTFMRGEDPIGQYVKHEGGAPPSSIIGVVNDLIPDGLESQPNPTVYMPFVQQPRPRMTFVVRTRNDAASVAAAIPALVLGINRDAPAYRIRTANTFVANSLGPRKFSAALMAGFAAAALGLAIIGLYAVISDLVAQGTREIGVRLALGATRFLVVRGLMVRVLVPSAAGLAVGIAASLLGIRAMQDALFGVSGLDIATSSVVLGIMSLACVAACAIPALRAVRVNPIQALRAE